MNAQFITGFIGFIAINLIVLGCSVLLGIILNGYKITDWKKLFLSMATLFFSQVFISEIILGTLRILTFQNALILNLVFLVFLLSVFGKAIYKKASFERFRIKGLFILIAVFTPFLAIFLIRYFNALFQIPLEYDNVAYHLPFITEWLKTGDLTHIYYSAFAGPLGYYPSNFELFGLWSYLPFGRDYLVNFVNFPIFPLLLVAIYSVARNLKIDRKTSLIVAALFLYMPQVFRQMGVPLVDLFFTFTFVVAIFFLQELWKSKSNKDIALFGLACGLFIGTKYLGLPYAFPLVLVCIVGIRRISSLLILIVTSLASGSFWYLRNFLDSGNPIFPVEVKLLGHKIFGGYYGLTDRVFGTSLLNNVINWPTFSKFYHPFYWMIGAPLFLILVAIIMTGLFSAASGIWLFFQKNKTKRKALISNIFLGLMLVAGCIYYFYFYWKAPYTFQDLIPNVRYAMMFLVVGCLTVGFITTKIKIIRSSVYFLAFTSFLYNIYFLVISPPPEIISNDKILLDYSLISHYKIEFILFLAVCFLIWLLAIFFQNSLTKRKIVVLPLMFLLICFLGFKTMTLTLTERENLRDYFAKMWYASDTGSQNYVLTEVAKWFDDNHPNAKIAYSGFNFHYHFYGRDLQRTVDYVNINDCLKCRYSDYKDDKDSIRRDPNFDAWMKNLKALQKDYLVIAPNILKNVKSYELEWANEHPDNFKLELQKGEVYVYRIL